jgi:hypothetical protein
MKVKVQVQEWDVPLADEEDFEECCQSGSIKQVYVLDVSEEEMEIFDGPAVPEEICRLSGFTPSRWKTTVEE